MYRRCAWGLILSGLIVTSAAGQPRQGEENAGGFGPAGRPDPMRMSPLMMALDADGDGVISAREMKRAALALRQLDVDEDGQLAADELRPQMPEPPGGFGRPDGQGGGPGRPGASGGFGGGPPGPEAFIAMAMQFDEDQDGKLSPAELGKMAQQFMQRGGGLGGQGSGGPGFGAQEAGRNAGRENGAPPGRGQQRRGGNQQRPPSFD